MWLESVTSAKALERLPWEQQRTLHISTKVIRGDFVHQILDGLGRALTTDLVVAQPFANMLGKGYRGHAVRRSAHSLTIDVIELIDFSRPWMVAVQIPDSGT